MKNILGIGLALSLVTALVSTAIWITGYDQPASKAAEKKETAEKEKKKEEKLPEFSDFQTKVSKLKPKKVSLRNNKYARLFRSRLRAANKEGVNFAGHYVIATWGCGTSCSQGGIIDTKTGKVYFPKALKNGFGLPLGYPEEKLVGEKGELMDFEKDSKLLKMAGYVGENNDEYGIRYYEWTGKELKLLKFVPVKVEL